MHRFDQILPFICTVDQIFLLLPVYRDWTRYSPLHIEIAPNVSPFHVEIAPNVFPFHVEIAPNVSPLYVEIKPNISTLYVEIGPNISPLYIESGPNISLFYVIVCVTFPGNSQLCSTYGLDHKGPRSPVIRHMYIPVSLLGLNKTQSPIIIKGTTMFYRHLYDFISVKSL